MDAFEVFEGDQEEKSICVAFRTDFARKLAFFIRQHNQGQNKTIHGLCQQILNASAVVDGKVSIDAIRDRLPHFEFAEHQDD